MFLAAMAMMADDSVNQSRSPAVTVPQRRHPVTMREAPEDLPTYSENMDYHATDHPEEVTRKAVQDHEKRLKRDIKTAHDAEVQCARIAKILPELYQQLNEEVAKSKMPRKRTGPAALREVDIHEHMSVKFKCRGIDQAALKRYLPILLADYQRKMLSAQEDTRPSVMLSNSAHSSHDDDTLRETGSSSSQQAPALNPNKMTVSASFFEDYVQKIYFSKKFLALFKKRESTGRRENLVGGIAIIIVGLKIGLPLFDLVTFTCIDCPRLALQKISGKQELIIMK